MEKAARDDDVAGVSEPCPRAPGHSTQLDLDVDVAALRPLVEFVEILGMKTQLA